MLNEENYNSIIFMMRGGAPDDVIMKSKGINANTLDRVKRSNGDYSTYKRLHGEEVLKPNARNAKKSGEQVVRHEQSVTIIANHYMAEELKKQTELLTLISNKLAYIMENLEWIKEAWK